MPVAQTNELEEMLDHLDMEAYLEMEGIDVRSSRSRKGVQLQIKECPCCGNENWKVYINAETGLGNCFVCNETFNRWKLVKSLLGNPAPVEVIKHIRGVVSELGWRPKRKAMAVEQPPDLVLPASMELPQGNRNLPYLIERGISLETTQAFQLRFCEMGWFPYTFNGAQTTQLWQKRLIIPIFDEAGVMVTFQGRDITGTSDKKYLFPPGLPSTGRYLLNAHNAQRAKTIVIGEGAFDVMAIKQALEASPDCRHAVPVGSFGKQLSMGMGNDQLGVLMKLKESGLREVVFMWDSEPQAIKDAVSAGAALNAYGFVTRLALLPAGKDPNEVPASVVRKAFHEAQNIDARLQMMAKLGRLMPRQ